MAQTRQLAAIMFTDIVGYTALMGHDEAKAFRQLNLNREIQKPVIAEYHGRWIKEMGDGVLASFSTVSDAVLAAIRIQQICNSTMEFRLRIGIHLGEVVIENDDVFGDGVNIASRIQSIAHPGSVFVSETVYNNIRNRKDLATEYVTTEVLKNVRDPLKIYQVVAEGIITAQPMRSKQSARISRMMLIGILTLILIVAGGYFLIPLKAKGSLPANEKSIAVLPFTDMSPDKDQEYLSDGLAEEIINSISIIKDLKVIGRTSSFQFKDTELDAQAIGKKLDAGMVLEGSVQKWGEQLRIITKLIRVRDNVTIWSQRFDKELKDIFVIQDTIAANIVGKLKVSLTESERPRLIRKETDPDVYSLYLKGLHRYKDDDYTQSIDYNLQAITLDSTFAPSYAYIALSKIWLINRTHSFTDLTAIRDAKAYAYRAIQLDPNLAEGHSALGLLAWSVELDFANAKLHFEKSIALNHSSSLIRNRYAYFLLWMDEMEKAERLGRAAISADPADFNGYVIVALACMGQQKFQEAEKFIAEGQRLFPGMSAFKNHAIQNTFAAGKYKEVIRMTGILETEKNDIPPNLKSLLSLSYLHTGDRKTSERILQELKQATPDPHSSIAYNVARIYAQYHEPDSCFAYLEKACAGRETTFRLFKIDPILAPVRQDPRYLQLYRRYGFDQYQ